MALVFQYGSNMSTARLNAADRLNGAAIDCGLVATSDRYELAFDVWSKRNDCAAADIVESVSGRQIWGVLYYVPDDCMPRLDRIEGNGKNYCRREISITTVDGAEFPNPVFTYMVREPRQCIKTNLAYVTHILNGLSEHSAPRDYVEYVRRRIVENDPALEIDRAPLP